MKRIMKMSIRIIVHHYKGIMQEFDFYKSPDIGSNHDDYTYHLILSTSFTGILIKYKSRIPSYISPIDSELIVVRQE